MRKVALVVFVAALLAPAVPASGAGEFTASGTIAFGNPASKVVGGITENVAACDPGDPDLQGLDGFWIQIPSAAAGQPATLTSDGVDTDVWFYTASCGLISDEADPSGYSMATDLTANENGAIPAAATFAIVDAAVGNEVSFTFTAATV